ncbi:unnamed protein product [Gongylonema pulchrum]|uniref:TBPIP domain-containing protein n=1 Tax=Gongylonema pulchrum TaxID=637853 RepID=A0A183E1D7_9BILA|nr:unnamed protein product [Gongylonema pulchrum]
MSKGQPDDVAIRAVCDYMKEQNRPYSAVDVWNNLHQKYPKAQVIKCLDNGVEQGVLCEKLISKQKIYFADQVLRKQEKNEEMEEKQQRKIEKCCESELQAMDKMIAEKKKLFDEFSNEIKAAKNGSV